MSTLRVTNIEPQSGDELHVTGSLIVSNIVRAREVVTTISSSQILVSGSTKFGDTSDDTHKFTGSLQVDGTVTADSYSGTFIGAVSGAAQIASEISGSSTSLSSSLAARITTAEDELGNTLLSSSAQIASEISGSFTSASSSLASRLTTAETELGNTLISGAAQIASEISGSSTSLSSSLASRVSTEESNVDLLQAHQGNILTFTGSADSEITALMTFTGSADAEITALMGATSSYALSSDVVANASTASFASTGSNTFTGNQVVSASVLLTLQQFTGSAPAVATGSLIVSGSPVQLYIYNGSGSGWNRV